MLVSVKVKKHADSREYVYDYPTLNEIEQLIKENYQVIIINPDNEQENDSDDD